MMDPNRRDASLDLTGEDFRALLAGVTALVEQEVAAARSGPVFERPPSAVDVDRMVGADRGLPADGESVEELLVLFRHAPPHIDEPALDAHNERILQALQRDGRVYLSNATVDGRFALRACITNFRTTPADVERVLTVVRELAG